MTLILGLESSCDETAVALVDSDRRVLAHRVAGQEAEHQPYGGVVPEIAARAHVDRLAPIVEGVLADAAGTSPRVVEQKLRSSLPASAAAKGGKEAKAA